MEILKFSPMLGLGWRDENAGVEFVKESRGRSKEFSNRYAAASVILIFSQNIVPRLEAADFVYKYSWFITRYKEDIVLTEHKDEDDWYLDSVNSLFVGETQELSRVGNLYNNL